MVRTVSLLIRAWNRTIICLGIQRRCTATPCVVSSDRYNILVNITLRYIVDIEQNIYFFTDDMKTIVFRSKVGPSEQLVGDEVDASGT